MKGKEVANLQEFSIAGIQYLTCVLSMLMILSSVTPSWAEGAIKFRTARKMFESSVSKRLSRNPVRPYTFPASTSVGLKRAVIAAQAQRAARFYDAWLQAPEQVAVHVGPNLNQSSAQFKDLIQIYKRTKQLLSQNTPGAREVARKQVERAISLVDKVVIEAGAIGTQKAHVREVMEFLSQARAILGQGKETTKVDLENLHQSGHGLESMFNNTDFQQYMDVPQKRYPGDEDGCLVFIVMMCVLIASVFLGCKIACMLDEDKGNEFWKDLEEGFASTK